MVLPELIAHRTAERGVKRAAPTFFAVKVPFPVVFVPTMFAFALGLPGLVTEVLLVWYPVFPYLLWVLGDVLKVLALAAVALGGKFLF